jgi:CRISPR-associated protein Cas1
VEELLRVMSLHALAYCERLFYLEEVEELRAADASVYEGRRLHLEAEDDASETFAIEAPGLGVKGRVDAIRRRDHRLAPVEIKKGRAAPGDGEQAVWRTDRLQVGAYALMLEEALSESVDEARVRYLASNSSIALRVDASLRSEVRTAIEHARELRRSIERPPVTDNERLCVRCSLASVCLPEEARFARSGGAVEPKRLFPPHPDRQALHVDAPGARVGRRGEGFRVEFLDGSRQEFASHSIGELVVHGLGQVSTQALALCSREDITVVWLTTAGHVTGCFSSGPKSAQRHARQFEALRDDSLRLSLARRLVAAKLESQLRFLLRATRGKERGPEVRKAVGQLGQALRGASAAEASEAVLGHEGAGAAAYFRTLPALVAEGIDERLRFGGRSRRPSRDRFNALLNFAYGLLYKDSVAAVLTVGLHPGFGFYHQPRSAALPLALDLMELFRVTLADMAVVAAVNRGTFDADRDFEDHGAAVWLSAAGRRKLLEVAERRRAEQWRHPVLGYSLSYARMVELEARLLEKEWTGEPGLFAKARLR